jgi:hypothetical protein
LRLKYSFIFYIAASQIESAMPYIPLKENLPGITGLLDYRQDTALPIRQGLNTVTPEDPAFCDRLGHILLEKGYLPSSDRYAKL